MEDFKDISKKYMDTLQKRAKKSRIYKSYQMTGLLLVELLQDSAHTPIYIRLAKLYDNQQLLGLAKTITKRVDIKNKGAYFMKMLKIQNISRINQKNE